MEIKKDFYPDEIARVLMSYARMNNEQQGKNAEQVTDALYNLMAVAENEYNNDFYRTLWDVLQVACAAFHYDEPIKFEVLVNGEEIYPYDPMIFDSYNDAEYQVNQMVATDGYKYEDLSIEVL